MQFFLEQIKLIYLKNWSERLILWNWKTFSVEIRVKKISNKEYVNIISYDITWWIKKKFFKNIGERSFRQRFFGWFWLYIQGNYRF